MLLTASLIPLAAIVGVFAWVVISPISLNQDTVEFTVEPGSTLRSAVRAMNAAGVNVPPWLFLPLAKAMHLDQAIKAGSYEVTRGVTPVQLLDKLSRGDVTFAEILFVEGWTFRQIRERLDSHPHLRHDTAALPEAAIMRLIQAPELPAEGAFFPGTYLVPRRSSDVEVLTRAYQVMQRHLAREWEARADGLPFHDPYQALIMASIVEKETGREEDRARIAGVFVNRLRRGMFLQTDPTVIYGLGPRFDGNLRKRDLTTDTAYNTYTRGGLPPTPIATPGLASLRAALHPSPTNDLYFVARGDGSSHFSRTLDEHQQAVLRYQRGGNAP